MALRSDEEFTRESFDRYLRANGVNGPVWRPHPCGESKPPDAELVLGYITYSVEITSLVTQYEQADGNTVPEVSIWRATTEMTKSVQDDLASAGLLRGSYVLTVDGPYDRFFKSMRLIRKRLVDFIISTKDCSETPRELVFELLPSGARFAINKYASLDDWVAAAMYSDGGDG